MEKRKRERKKRGGVARRKMSPTRIGGCAAAMERRPADSDDATFNGFIPLAQEIAGRLTKHLTMYDSSNTLGFVFTCVLIVHVDFFVLVGFLHFVANE